MKSTKIKRHDDEDGGGEKRPPLPAWIIDSIKRRGNLTPDKSRVSQ